MATPLENPPAFRPRRNRGAEEVEKEGKEVEEIKEAKDKTLFLILRRGDLSAPLLPLLPHLPSLPFPGV